MSGKSESMFEPRPYIYIYIHCATTLTYYPGLNQSSESIIIYTCVYIYIHCATTLTSRWYRESNTGLDHGG